MTPLEMYATSWFALTFVLIVDTYLSLQFDLYGYFFEGGFDYRTLIVHFGIYPTYNIIFLNFFPKKRLNQLLYILGHSFILVAFEWTTIKVGAFHHKEWEIWYSAMLYPIILLILYWNLKLLRVLKNKE